ncbi:MAG: hypothetical protein FWG85_06490 [Bacteroidetes bacterium]|nr:hypothetical protein [Bacteroidota bacterium]
MQCYKKNSVLDCFGKLLSIFSRLVYAVFTIKETLKFEIDILKAHNIESSDVNAEMLLCWILDLSRIEIRLEFAISNVLLKRLLRMLNLAKLSLILLLTLSII